MRLLKMFRYGTDVVEHGHKGGISVPARHQMKMQVFADASTGGLPKIQADIYTFTPEMFLENPCAMFEHVHDFRAFLVGKISEIHRMPVWANHDMPVVVGVFVHDNKREGIARQYQTLPVFLHCWRNTENTTVRFRP